MTVPSTTRRAGPYTGTGSQTAFPFSFRVFGSGDVRVTLAAAGVEVIQTPGVHYTVSINTDQDTTPGGTVNMAVAPTALQALAITGGTPFDQTLDLPAGGAYSPRALENALDRIVFQIQRLAEEQGRTLTLPTTASGTNTQLPAPSPGAPIGWNDTGTGLRNIDPATLASIVAYANRRTLVANGGASSYTLAADPGNASNTMVAVSGVVQTPGVDYTVSGLVLTPTTPWPAGTGNVVIVYGEVLPTGVASADAVTFTPSGTGATARTVQARLRDTVFASDYGFTSTGVQLAINALPASGGKVVMPAGVYTWTAPVTTRSNVTIEGDGYATQIDVATDIEVFNSDTATVDTLVFGAMFRDFYIRKTFSGATTKYDIHLQNPMFCRMENVRIQSGHDDNVYSATNVGGIWLDRPPGSTITSFCNFVNDCWMQNNSVYLRNITDSVIKGGYVWGHTRQFAIRVNGGGNIGIEAINGIITSKYNGGIWLDGSGLNQIRVVDVEFDGNPLLDLGPGIYCPQAVVSVVVSDSTFWGCGRQAIDVTDPVGWVVSGNSFWKNNSDDASHDDIRITGSTFSPNGNVFSGNSHIIDDARTNKGYAIKEVNAGFAPAGNVYTNNGIAGNYLSPGILVLSYAEVSGNVGNNAETVTNLTGSTITLGSGAPGGMLANASGNVAAAGTLDMTINTASYLSNPGGFAGILTVTATRADFPTQSRRTVYAAVVRGTTATFTSLATQDGSAGGSAFTVTMASNGVIRFTDTSGSGSAIGVRMAFFGSRSLA